MQYIINSSSIVFFHNGKPTKIEKSSAAYPRIIKAFDLVGEDQEKALNIILNETDGNFIKDGFAFTPEDVFYKDERLPEVLANKVRSISQEGLPVTLFANFWENLQKNPSSSSVRELYDFLAYKELPITEDGCFLAYKGLTANGWSVSGNKKTKVIAGKVNDSGHIYNGIGEKIEVRRFDVDDDRANHCSFGLHVGSLEYAIDFGTTTVIVKVNPKDVVSVPSDFNCQKCRVSAYEVLDTFGEEITSAITDEDGEALKSEESEEYFDFLERVDNYISKKIAQGSGEFFVKAIQNSFSPEYPSRVRILDAIDELGYVWGLDQDGREKVFI